MLSSATLAITLQRGVSACGKKGGEMLRGAASARTKGRWGSS